MKAIVFEKYGSVENLKIKDVPTPEPKDDEIRVKIKSTIVTAGDCEIRRFDFPIFLWIPIRLLFGIFKPRVNILGQTLSGIIDKVGNNVTKFKVGDEIFAGTGPTFGGYAEYVTLKQNQSIAKLPNNMNFDEAATLPMGFDVLHFLGKAKLKKGETILITGAAGSIGTIAVQVAKANGTIVTAVDTTDKQNILKEIGADYVIDYKKENFYDSANKYDVIFDLVNTYNISDTIKSLKNNGRYLLGTPTFKNIILGLYYSIFSNKKVYSQFANDSVEALETLKEYAEKKSIKSCYR